MDPLRILCQGKFLPDLSSLRCCPSGECTFDDSTGTTLDETNFTFGRVLLLLPQHLRLGSNRFVYRSIYTRGFYLGGVFGQVPKQQQLFFFGKFYNKKKRLQENNIYITLHHNFAGFCWAKPPSSARKKTLRLDFSSCQVGEFEYLQVLSQMLS